MTQTILANGLCVAFDLAGDAQRPVVVLSHHLGTNRRIWDAQVSALRPSFRVLAYDIRGHGDTDVPNGPYTIDMLGNDVLSLLDALSIERAHFVGASLGGFIGQWLAARAAERVDRLVLVNTAPRLGPPAGWDARIASIRAEGIESVVEPSIERWFTAAFVASAPAVVEPVRAMLLETSVEGYAACCIAIRDMDLRPLAPTIRAPALVIAGTDDFATPPADSEWLTEHIPHATLLTLPAAHMAHLEAADDVTTAIARFLSNAGD